MMFKKEYLLLISIFFVLLCCNPLCAVSVDDEMDNITMTDSNNEDILSDDSIDFSANTTEGIDSLDVQFNVSDDDYDSYYWNFGDGTNSSLKNPNHTYNIGSYNVSLNVSKAGVNKFIIKNNFINVYKDKSPVINPGFEENNGWELNSRVRIFNFPRFAHSGSCAIEMATYGLFYQNITFDIIESLEVWVSQDYEDSFFLGIYADDELIYNITENLPLEKWVKLSLDVSKVKGFHLLKFRTEHSTFCIDDISVKYDNFNNIFSDFTFDALVEGDDINVNFKDASLGLISNWLWDFGDGSTSTLENPTHKFKPGNYNVTLTVSNANYTRNYSYNLKLAFPTINGQMYNTIQDAIDNASENATILIPNDYTANLIINKSLTLDFNGNKLLSSDSSPIINVTNGNVVVKNLALSGVNNIFTTSNSSSLTILNSTISNANITLSEGNIDMNFISFNNSYVSIFNTNVLFASNNVSNGGVVVSGGKSKLIGNLFSGNDVAINQTAGESNITNNIINNNNVGINVTGGNAVVSFNAIYNNQIGGLVYVENVTASNNWYGTNSPNTSGSESYLLAIITAPNEMYAGDEYKISIDLTKNGEGVDTSSLGTLPIVTLMITSNGGSITNPVTIKNGKGEFKLFTGHSTVDNVNFKILDETYNTLEQSSIISKPIETNIAIESSEKTVVVITLKDIDGNPVSGVNITYEIGNDNKTVVSDVNGSFTIKGLVGEVSVKVAFEGNKVYAASSNIANFTFTEKTKIIAPSVNMVYGVGKYLIITLKDEQGNALINHNLIVRINGATVIKRTNNKGQVLLAINLAPKTYMVTISFAGDNYYLKSSALSKVVVFKAIPKLTAAKKAYKVKVKTKKYTITLKTNKGKVLKKAKVTLKVKGKTYKATTNSKGKATFKITKLTKKGTYKAVVKFSGNSYYKAISKTVKLKIKE